MRGRTHAPSPPRGAYRRRSRSPRERHANAPVDGRNDSTTLIVFNLHVDSSPVDLRALFRPFGRVINIYRPNNYYTREPKSYAFIQFCDHGDASEAKFQMDGYSLRGRRMTVKFANNRVKTTDEMRAREQEQEQVRAGLSSDRRGSPSYSPYPSPRHGYSPSPTRRDYSRPYSRHRRSSRSPAQNR